MKKRGVVCLLLLSLLLSAGIMAHAQDMAGKALSTGKIVSQGAALYDTPSAASNKTGALSGGTAVVILQTSGEWTQVFVRAQRLAGWVSGNSVIWDSNVAVYPGIVISQSVSLRDQPSTGAKLVASIPNGAMMDLLDEQNGWYYVSYLEPKANQILQGWVREDFIVRNPAYLTTTQATYVYAMPSRDAKKIGQLVSGTQLVIIGEYGDFWVVNLRSASGFIHKNDIEWGGNNG